MVCNRFPPFFSLHLFQVTSYPTSRIKTFLPYAWLCNILFFFYRNVLEDSCKTHILYNKLLSTFKKNFFPSIEYLSYELNCHIESYCIICQTYILLIYLLVEFLSFDFWRYITQYYMIIIWCQTALYLQKLRFCFKLHNEVNLWLLWLKNE